MHYKFVTGPNLNVNPDPLYNIIYALGIPFWSRTVNILEFTVIVVKMLYYHEAKQYTTFREFRERVENLSTIFSNLNKHYSASITAALASLTVISLSCGIHVALQFIMFLTPLEQDHNKLFILRLLGFIVGSILIVLIFFILAVLNNMMLSLPFAANVEDSMLGNINNIVQYRGTLVKVFGISANYSLLSSVATPLIVSAVSAAVPVWIQWAQKFPMKQDQPPF